ncbi:MAG: hypothetical protein IJW37_04470 [Lachnospiraceae bacterium]|nr:hypothetical protein [Lachnospiraceae bacterium]
MDDKKYVSRFFAGVTLVAMAYAGYAELRQVTEATETVRPLLNLTSGEVIDPATAPEVMKYNNATAKEFAEHVFGDAEEAPDLNEFLSRFTCSACGKRCLLTSPRCNKGKGSQEKAIVIYQEMFPEVELFSSNGITFSIKL